MEPISTSSVVNVIALCILIINAIDSDHRQLVPPLLRSLPDHLADWRGTAAELADRCNELLAGVPSLADDAGSANERLVRHYVQVGILTSPDREGREAMFRRRQIVEFLAARYLLKDGWPLAKVAELVRATDVAGLTELIPSERPRARSERTAVPQAMRLESPLARAAGISRRRVSLEENLKALGNPDGRAGRNRMLRIELAPWCHVYVDPQQLCDLSEDTPEVLGDALTQALLEERLQKEK